VPVAEDAIVGKVGRVTGEVAAGTVGEVMLSVRGGAEAFYAYPADGNERLAPGTRVVVVDYEPPRTVTVTALA
jgi:membrane protein implicated in regulation of membrane protease activity